MNRFDSKHIVTPVCKMLLAIKGHSSDFTWFFPLALIWRFNMVVVKVVCQDTLILTLNELRKLKTLVCIFQCVLQQKFQLDLWDLEGRSNQWIRKKTVDLEKNLVMNHRKINIKTVNLHLCLNAGLLTTYVTYSVFCCPPPPGKSPGPQWYS